MLVNHRPRRPAARQSVGARTAAGHLRERVGAALTAGPVHVVALLLTASCADQFPNSVFTRLTEFNRDVAYLFAILIALGTAVFVLVESILLFTLVRFRRRRGAPDPKHVHGNTTLEILWTMIPAIVLVFIAVPTVRTIFRTQAKPRPGALEVTVIGHQWWWEFRYPQYTAPGANGRLDTLVTANELYLPIGRTVNFTLKTMDVLHSFWVPQLSGKRDLIANHTNYLWFTPDSTPPSAWNGFCAEYCGASHANMRFRAFTVSATDFDAWARHQLTPAVAVAPSPPPAGPPGGAGAAPPAQPPGQTGANTPINAPTAPESTRGAATVQGPPTGPPTTAGAQRGPLSTASGAGGPAAGQAPASGLQFVSFAREALRPHNIPRTPIPRGLEFNDALRGDAARGAQLFASGQGGCIGCHAVRGVPTAVGIVGPNLTHVGARTTIAAGLYPNEPRYLARWIKNARAMKPGVIMPALGRGEYDPVTKQRLTAGLDDQQIADLVAYLQSLK